MRVIFAIVDLIIFFNVTGLYFVHSQDCGLTHVAQLSNYFSYTNLHLSLANTYDVDFKQTSISKKRRKRIRSRYISKEMDNTDM